MVDKKIIEVFNEDISKDTRNIRIFDNKDHIRYKVMRKYNMSKDEHDLEIDILNFLKDSKFTGFPKVINYGIDSENKYYIDLEYYEGIRVFNLLVTLNNISHEQPHLKTVCSELRGFLICRCRERQLFLQKVLKDWNESRKKSVVYPYEKLFVIIEMICNVLPIEIDMTRLKEELSYIYLEYKNISEIPFRDASIKNMLVNVPSLYLGNFLFDKDNINEALELRKEKIIDMLNNNCLDELLSSPIIDYDFSSCVHLTSKYDDPISFCCHEYTWDNMPFSFWLNWDNDSLSVNKDIAITFIIRYIRYGGRKLLYHIIHPNAYKVRHKYDNEKFYFEKLKEAIYHFWPEADTKIPEFIKFIDLVIKSDISINDYDVYENNYPQKEKNYYVDIYPY